MKHLAVIIISLMLFLLFIFGGYMLSLGTNDGEKMGWTFYFIGLFGISTGWGATLYNKYF